MSPRSARSSKTLTYRLRWMLQGWGTVGLVYVCAHYLQGQGHLVPVLWLDQLIAYDERAIWVYLSFFILIPLAYLASSITRVRLLARQMQCSALICGVVYILYPTTMLYPQLDISTVHGDMMRLLVVIDSAQNCFPSLHALLSVLAFHALSHKQGRLMRCLYACWLLCIIVSILLLKRHLSIDVAAGVMIAYAVIGVSQYQRWRRFKQLFFRPSMKRLRNAYDK